MSLTSPDAKAVVAAVDALMTQVRRIADALTTPVVRVGDGMPTTANDGPRCVSCGAADVRYRNYREQPFCWPCANGEQAPAADDVIRAARHDSLGMLLSRISNGLTLTPDEAKLLVEHVDAEVREGTTARAVAAGNKRHVQTIVPEIDRLAAELEQAQTRADQAEELLRVAHETSNRSEAERARAVQRAEQADAVTAETKRLLERRTTTLRERAERAEAAIERVRALHRKASHGTTCVYCAHGQRLGYDTDWPCDTIRALDGPTEENTTP